ncbi:MAG TPA: DUF2064 domain-containing protein [Asanoa sp.]
MIVLDGQSAMPPAWTTVTQRGTGLGERLHHAFVATRRPGVASLPLGMDTPQATVRQLTASPEALAAP